MAKMSLTIPDEVYNKFKRWQNWMYGRTGSDVFAFESRAITWFMEKSFEDPILVARMRARELNKEFQTLIQQIQRYDSLTKEEKAEALREDPCYVVRRKLNIDSFDLSLINKRNEEQERILAGNEQILIKPNAEE